MLLRLPVLTPAPLRVRLVAEALGTTGLLAAVVGSGVMAQRLTDDVALQLLVNAAATVAVLGVLISTLGPLSGAHLNPVVTLAQAARGRHAWREVGPYAAAQVVGAVAGTAVANLMFDLPALHVSTHERTGAGLWLGEVVATTGLVLAIGLLRDSGRAALVVPAWIFGAYFLTSSTSFANPAVTLARGFSDTFSGIAPSSVPAFVVAQLLGAAVALGLLRILDLPAAEIATAKEAPHEPETVRPVRLRPQRGALADGRGIPRAPRGRRRGGALRREPTSR